MDLTQRMNMKCRQDGQKMVRMLIEFCVELERLVSEIKHGVSENGEFDKEIYRIPKSLVDSFGSLLMMVIAAAQIAKVAYNNRRENISLSPPLSFVDSETWEILPALASDAQTYMDDSKQEIIMMVYTDDLSEIVSYEALSPEYVLGVVMGINRCRDSEKNQINLSEAYKGYMLKLQFKVNQHPDRRLLQDLYLVAEELGIIKEISNQQRVILSNYRKILEPSSFHVTTESRISAFKLESTLLQDIIDVIDAELSKIETLTEKAHSLARQTRDAIEVRHEDHGKAILVFTIVTIVFLPLSFVSSLLGMNTVDMRNMNNTQTIFWIIALPLTLFIITGSLFIGFKADRIREAFAFDVSTPGVSPTKGLIDGRDLKRAPWHDTAGNDNRSSEIEHSSGGTFHSALVKWKRRQRSRDKRKNISLTDRHPGSVV